VRDHVERGPSDSILPAEAEHVNDVAVLAYRRVSEELLEDVARERQNAADEDGRGAKHQKAVEEDLALVQEWVHSPDQQDPRGYHRRRVQVGGDRRWRRHRPRQPEVKRRLGALRECGDRDEEPRDGEERTRLDHAGELWNGKGPVGGAEHQGAYKEEDRRDTGYEQGHERR
jgi:hypothetical protein